MIYSYIHNTGEWRPRFKGEQPGLDWVDGFMSRHRLTVRITSNIKRNWAAVSPKVIHSYFDNLEVDLHGISPENM